MHTSHESNAMKIKLNLHTSFSSIMSKVTSLNSSNVDDIMTLTRKVLQTWRSIHVAPFRHGWTSQSLLKSRTATSNSLSSSFNVTVTLWNHVNIHHCNGCLHCYMTVKCGLYKYAYGGYISSNRNMVPQETTKHLLNTTHYI